MGCTGPVKRGKKHISISLKIHDAQCRWITCPEVSVCLSVSLEGVQMTVPDHGHKIQCLKTGEVYLAVYCFVFSWKSLCWNSFLKAAFGWAANSRSSTSACALHSRVLGSPQRLRP